MHVRGRDLDFVEIASCGLLLYEFFHYHSDVKRLRTTSRRVGICRRRCSPCDRTRVSISLVPHLQIRVFLFRRCEKSPEENYENEAFSRGVPYCILLYARQMSDSPCLLLLKRPVHLCRLIQFRLLYRIMFLY